MEYRSAVAQMARDEMSSIMEKMRIDRLLKHATPVESLFKLNSGDKVLVRREINVENRISEWMGPFLVIEFDA